MDIKLGELKSVPLREIWEHEEYGFTPWLARPENLARLAETLGFELEIESTEVPVGPFSADMVARDTTNNRVVVIENQLARTNHDHLGKIVTYGSVLDANVIVWIAPQFTDEHKRAIAWLNDKMTESVEFFGVRPELWRIDGSNPAIRFEIVAGPSKVVKQANKAVASGALSGVKETQLEFWQRFADLLIAKKVLTYTQTPRGRYSFHVALGKTGVFLANTVSPDEGRIRVRVYINAKNKEAVYAKLLAKQNEIERAIGEPLQWNPLDSNDKTIVLAREADLADRNQWQEYLEWMVERTARVRSVFMPILRTIDIEGGPADSELE